MIKTLTDIVVPKGETLDLSTVSGIENGPILIQNKGTTPIVVRTLDMTTDDGLVLNLDATVLINFDGTMYVKNTGYSLTTVSITLMQ